MIAVDTNIIVQLLTSDHPQQTDVAQSLFASGPIWIAKTVLIETAWELRKLYGFEEDAICVAFGKLLGLENVHAEDETAVTMALALATKEIEFADAIHLNSRPTGIPFHSFDQKLVRRATRAGVERVSDAAKKRSPVGLAES
jgi:predicted nucleic-acid-binding protein